MPFFLLPHSFLKLIFRFHLSKASIIVRFLTLKGVGVLGTRETFRFGVSCSRTRAFSLSLKPGTLQGLLGVPSFSLFAKGKGRFRGEPLRVKCRGVDELRGVALRKREGEKRVVKFLKK